MANAEHDPAFLLSNRLDWVTSHGLQLFLTSDQLEDGRQWDPASALTDELEDY